MKEDLQEAALRYHELPTPGKTAVSLTKPAETIRDLSLAYSPGVAEPVRAIAKDTNAAYRYTNKGNTVAVISNGSAILGLGHLGALASKPVMEGKALLFKRFANIDAIDLEIDCHDPQQFIEMVRCLSPSFGGINLEDIKAPECFEIEQQLIEQCDIPIFHDDQHGTAVVMLAALLNALEITQKKLESIRIVCMGAGAAAISCCQLLLSIGLQKDHLYMLDRNGIIHTERQNIPAHKAPFALKTPKRTLDDAIEGADVFIGLSGPSLLKEQHLRKMASQPIVFACANPDPEIHPVEAKKIRHDIIIATGRSDLPNQVNNVLCFPFIFRGALDVRASQINRAMKVAAAEAIRSLAKKPVPNDIINTYKHENLQFGPNYIIPKPFDKRLLNDVSMAVAQAAIESGVAKKPYI